MSGWMPHSGNLSKHLNVHQIVQKSFINAEYLIKNYIPKVFSRPGLKNQSNSLSYWPETHNLVIATNF